MCITVQLRVTKITNFFVTQQKVRLVPVAKDDAAKISECATLLANEFADPLRSEEEYQKNIKLFTSPTSYCFHIVKSKKFIGIIILNHHPWEHIKEQLYIYPAEPIQHSEYLKVSLTPFKKLIREKKFTPHDVIDYTYTYIVPEERGKGYAGMAWKLQENYVRKHFPNSICIVIVRKANCARTDCQTVLLHMLSKERQAQGLDPSDYVQVKGIPISTKEIKKAAHITYPISFFNGVKEMSHLASKYEFKPFAFTKAFCPVFIKQTPPIREV